MKSRKSKTVPPSKKAGPSENPASKEEAKIPAYDLKKAAEDCRKAGYGHRHAIAWLAGNRVQIALLPRGKAQPSTISKLTPSAANRPPRKVVCIAFNMGDAWRPWDEVEVSEALLNLPSTPKDKRAAILPLEHSIFDPDKSDGVWFMARKEDTLDRCKHFAQAARQEIDRIRKLADVVFTSASAQNSMSLVSSLLSDCLAAIERFELATDLRMLIHSCQLDTAVAIRQGFLIGRWLAQAEARCAASEGIKFMAPKGAGRKPQQFWKHVVESEPFERMTESEVFAALHGRLDPDHSGTTMRVDEATLYRGNGRKVKESSFCSRLRSLRADAKRRKTIRH